jgi:hypothetical protein
LPEAHAIYWGGMGLKKAKEHPDKVKAEDLITLRRLIYQSMLAAFHHGRIVNDPYNPGPYLELEPNLQLIPKVNDAYLKSYEDETQPNQKTGILKAHRNFLKDAVYFLYENNRVADAAKWYKILGEKYPDNTVLDGDMNSYPRNLTLDEYAVARVQSEIHDTSQERMTGVIEGLIARSYYQLAIGEDDRSIGFRLLARKIYDSYYKKIGKMQSNIERVGLPPFDVMNRTVLNRLLDPQEPVLPYAARAILRTQLSMPAETNAPPAPDVSTNAPVTATNAVENVPTNSAAK